jgi:hypothetical protein
MGFEASSLSRNEASWIWFKGLIFRLEEKLCVCSSEREREYCGPRKGYNTPTAHLITVATTIVLFSWKYPILAQKI